jgi:ABC-2 type transport system permease protein
MLRFDWARLRQWLVLYVMIQLLMGAGMTVMYGFFLPEVPPLVAAFITTGVPTLAIVPIGFVVVPQTLAQQRLEGSYEFIFTLPVPKLAVAASSFTLLTFLALPGVAVALAVGGWRYGVSLDVGPAVIPAVLLSSLMAASVGYALGHLLANPQVVALVTNLVVFFVLLFAPIVFPASQYPGWLQAVNAVLPFEHMATTIRAALAPALVPNGVVADYAILVAWTVGGWVVAAWIVGRRG